MILAAAAAAFAFGAPACDGALCNAATLQPALARLAALSPTARAGRPFHILQIGDSHSAGDAITGAWRDALQARYGSGGRGVLPPGRPYDGYITHGVTAAMSPGWSIAADFGKGWTGLHAPLGLAAFAATSLSPGATMALDAEANERFDRLVVCAIARPGAGSLLVTAGSATQRLDLGSLTERPQCTAVRSDAPATHAELASDGGPVTITSWATFRETGGVVLSNLGVVGSQLVHFSRTDDAVIAEELRAYRPDLIVLAFGTNEGFAPRVSPFEYEIILRTQIGRLRRLAANVPILLLGAPDALTRRADLRTNADGVDTTPCADGGGPTIAATAPATAATAPVATTATTSFAGAMQRLGSYLGLAAAQEGTAASPPGASATVAPAAAASTPPASAAPRGGALFPPAGLQVVRDVQRRVAASLHVAYWDWAAAMGGRCTALRWARATPPMMRGDYVHYTSAGGREIARRLQADLDRVAAP